jgi:hypothetical protein
VLGFDASDFRHSGEDVSAVDRRSLHAVPMIDLSVARLFVQVELANTHCNKKMTTV